MNQDQADAVLQAIERLDEFGELDPVARADLENALTNVEEEELE